MTLQNALIQLFERVSGTRATPRSSAAVARFGPYLGGMIAAKSLSIIGQLLVSRMLGPAQFGRLAVALATANIIALPLAGAWGSAYVRYTAGQPETTWAPLLRWATHRTLGSVALLAAVVALATPFVASALEVPPSVLLAGALLGVCMAMWLLAKVACQGREDWQRFVATEMLWGAAIVVGPWLLNRHNPLTWMEAAVVFAIAYLIGGFAAGRYFAAAARGGWRAAASPAEQFGVFALLTGVGNTMFLYTDRFVAQRMLGFADVGIYQVYSFVTVGIATLMATLLNNFAFPLFPQGDRRAFGDVFRRTLSRLLPIALPGLVLAGAIQIYFTRFPFRPGLLIMASLTATAYFLAAFYGNLVLSLGVAGSRMTARMSGLSLVVFAVGVVPAVWIAGLAGLFGLYTAIFLAVALLYQRGLNRFGSDRMKRLEANGAGGA
jgi:O-antigen/teichoic acid export membrane protein